ncbi:MAG TPA: glycoside hydrolase family 3 C-terminal domain-containing protein [Phycisphaerae bacterium]|nr:glycoside hydrolase family 3 C-terminal domain-containing protein [Phycisphaerae bacterium]
MPVLLAAALLTLACTAAARAQSAPATLPDTGGPNAPWRNPSLSPDARARDLLPRLTLTEKISLLHADGTFTSPGLPRFGIPKLWMSDGPQGVREEIQPTTWNSANHTDDFSTAMPADIALAASFDPDLAKAYGNVIGQEARARHKNIMLCPGLNIMRTPLNGRNSEYFGEDPFLASRMAVNFVEGIQQNGVAACIKHFALNNQETNRGSVNVHVDERTLHEIYLPAFKAAVTEAHAWCLMTAYNRVNGQYCSENHELLTDILKHDWQFPGLVMTDWGGAHSTIDCATNGLDLEMGSNVGGSHDNDFLAAKLLAAVNAGQVPMARIDDMALRNLRVMTATGNLDPTPQSLPPADTLLSPDHIAAARTIAESGIVLLKNADALLPLDSAKIHSIAVIGQNASAKFAHNGNSAAIKTSHEVTPLEGITKRAGDAIKITYVEGYTRAAARGGRRGIGGAVTPTSATAPATQSAQIAQAVAAAKSADVAIVVAGLYRAQDQEGADRPNMNLPSGQSELIAAVAKANPHTIVILNGGSPSVVAPWIDDSAALLMYWYGGTEGGNALARVLFGDVNPSGHLPCTWPKQLADTPASHPNDPAIFPGIGNNVRGAALTPDTGPQETYAEKLLVGYRWYDSQKIDPQFPFGFGLSYTTFGYSNLHIDPASHQMQCDVANTGPRAGDAVVQVYVEPLKPSVDRPLEELKAFQKIALKPGEKQTVTLDLPPAAFAYYSPNKHAWIAEAGDYIIHVGDSSRSLPLHQTFHLDKTLTIPEAINP